MYFLRKNFKRQQAHFMSLVFVLSFVCQFMQMTQANTVLVSSANHLHSESSVVVDESFHSSSQHCHPDVDSNQSLHKLSCCESSSSCHQKSLLTQHHQIDQVDQLIVLMPNSDWLAVRKSTKADYPQRITITDYGSSRPRQHLINCLQLI